MKRTFLSAAPLSAALFGAALLGVLVLGPQNALGQGKLDARTALAESHAALSHQESTRAIELLEQLADHGEVHPDLSFNRGVAYLERSASALARPGDHGQAAAAFEETLLWSPDDAEAERGLEDARLRVARRQARSGERAPIDTEPLLLRALSVLSPRWLFAAAALGSCLATLGLLGRGSQRPNRRLAAGIAALVGVLLLLSGAAADWGRRALWTSTIPAVVVSERASLLDASGRPLAKSASLLEGQSVRVRGFEGKLARIASGTGDLRVLSSTLRVLPTPHGP